MRVGLAWLGQSSGEGIRRTELRQLAEALASEGVIGLVEFYGLPIEALTDEERGAAQQLGMVHPQWSFEDEAAALVQMDLVISIDTSHAHLAGALGVPCWVLLKLVPDWRWGIQGEHSPWYPHARLFRQVHANDWDDPLRQVAVALRQMAQSMGHLQ
jgi:ADP-heptose:LPS heptosyltransferase